MTLKQQKFVRAYLGECNGNSTKAAIAAGYSENGASVAGTRLLANASVHAAIQRGIDKVGLSTDDCLNHLAVIASTKATKIQARDIINANALILKVKGALTSKEQSTGITVNIGYLLAQRGAQPAADAIDVTPRVSSAESRPPVPVSGSSRET